MNPGRLIIRSISRYKPFYRLIAIAVMVAVAVITGSLVVGDSVRSTLVKRVEERLGKTQTIVFSRYSYLDEAILKKLGASSPPPASLRGVLLLNGFISISGTLTPVMVWGIDDLDIQKGQAKINPALHNEIKAGLGRNPSQYEPIVLRLPAAGMVPLGSMYVTDTYTTSLRLALDSVVPVEEGGNINLKNEQTIPLNIFLNREELSKAMDITGKINLILSDWMISTADFASAWHWTYSGLKVEPAKTTITSDRIFIQNQVVETLYKDDSASNRMYTYLANSIGNHSGSIPYSFITAVDYYRGEALNPNEIIISDYTAQRLNVRVKDTLTIGYFISRQLKTLVVDSLSLIVAKIVPIGDLQADNSLKAEFPGLSNVERCTDWNSDLPINMKLITDEDEDYWRKYKNTPKAIVPYSALAPRWKNAFGSATALALGDMDRLQDLSYEMFDIQLIHPREAGIIAAQSGVDFSSLFLSLGIFIIISAALLMAVPLSEMLFRRRDELKLLQATGFSNRRILGLLWRESTPVVLVSALSGVVAGLLYTYLVLFLLGTVWKGATHTGGFRMYPDIATIAAGVSIGIIFSMLLLYLSIRRTLKKRPAKNKPRKARLNKSFAPSTLMWASIFYSRKQAILSFVSLASGVLIVFSVGLNRRSFADSSQIRTATGGFSLWCETSVPVYHNLQTQEGRSKLALTDLPNEARVVQLLKYSADDASCLNLNKVVTPNVLGIDMKELLDSDFKITKTILDTPDGGAYPALVDETVLQWSLGKQLGDTLIYMGEKGERVSIRLTGTIQNSIFQGYILIDKSFFSEIWSEISGSEIMLVSLPDHEVANTKALISQALNNYGVRITTTGERLQLFYSVTDTYLTIFLTLGGLGLLLGMFSFIIVVRKNIVARLKEVTLYRSLGFDEQRITGLLYKENILIPLFAISTGALASLLGISMGFGHVGAGIWTLALAFLAVLVLCVVVFVKSSVRAYLQHT
ncbi:MAG: FtsX-like permease family protein [Bacteroidales bacterium]|nr:FtsX-like permease family protein [Bacteroidales bacterium]